MFPDLRFFVLLFAAFAGGTLLRGAELKTIVFFGDSLTAGYGLEDPSTEAFPALIEEKIHAAGLPWRVVNAGLSGETTAAGRRRVDWILRQKVDLFVLALGANDGLRGVPAAETRANLKAIIERVRTKFPQARVVLAGMQMPTNLGPEYTQTFRDVFPAVAKEAAVPFIPFLLEGVGGRPELNQPDGIHPTAAGHARMAETVWTALRPLL